MCALFRREAGMPDHLPIRPASRERYPSLTDEEYIELCDLVEGFPNFFGEDDPKYKRWYELQKKADGDFHSTTDVFEDPK
jgi:hypothetical protein